MKNLLIITLVVFSFIACGESSKKIQKKEEGVETITNVSSPEGVEDKKNVIQHFTKKQIARAAISGIMGRPIKTIKVDESDEIFLVSYVRQDDKQFFLYKVKVGDINIVWGSSDGRWRTHKFDSKIKYSSTKDKLLIMESYSDGSASKYEFTQKDFN